MFCGQLGAKQVCAVFHALQDDYTASVECLLGKVDLNWIISHLNRLYSKQPIQKIKVDDDELWQDMIIMYKNKRLDFSQQIRVTSLQLTLEVFADKPTVRFSMSL